MHKLCGLTLKGVLLRSAPSKVGKRLLMNWRAEPANTPLVEQAPMALVFVGWVLVGTARRLFLRPNCARRHTGDAEPLQRLMSYARNESEGVRKAGWGAR